MTNLHAGRPAVPSTKADPLGPGVAEIEDAMPVGPSVRPLASCLVFTALAILSRSTFRLIETRWQIAALWTLAAVIEFAIVPATGQRPSRRLFLAEAVCVAIACTTVKWIVEGRILS